VLPLLDRIIGKELLGVRLFGDAVDWEKVLFIFKLGRVYKKIELIGMVVEVFQRTMIAFTEHVHRLQHREVRLERLYRISVNNSILQSHNLHVNSGEEIIHLFRRLTANIKFLFSCSVARPKMNLYKPVFFTIFFVPKDSLLVLMYAHMFSHSKFFIAYFSSMREGALLGALSHKLLFTDLLVLITNLVEAERSVFRL
jgi:hypothetical protein